MQTRKTFSPRFWWAWTLAALAIAGLCALMLAMRTHPGAPAQALRPPAPSPSSRLVPPPPLPAAPESAVMPVSEMEAKDINARMAFSTAPVEAARPFILKPVDGEKAGPTRVEKAEARNMATDCLAAAIYYEAASESELGQRAVAQVVLNRVRHPAFPKSICGVVYQGMERSTGCQFTFTCDGSLARRPSEAGWARARRIALAALDGKVEPIVGTATHYHTDWVVPYWAPSLDKITMIGAHIFYRWKGFWGHRAAFDGAYAGESMTGVPLHIPYEGVADLDADLKAADMRVRPLADQTARLSALPAPQKLRADEESGGLKIDQQPVMLEADRPAAASSPEASPPQRRRMRARRHS